MSLIRLGLLTKTGRTIFKKLSIFKKEGILAGRTGLMLQIGHRYSYDFDVFFQRPLQESDYHFCTRQLKVFENNFSKL